MKKPVKSIYLYSVAVFTAVQAVAEFGISAGGSANYKAGFRNRAQAQSYRSNFGAAAAGVDHYYDDGFNRVDNTGNQGNQTTLWGYQNAAQDNGGTLTMNSSRTVVNQQGSSASDSGIQPSLEIYWQDMLTDYEKWNFGLRVAWRWQRIELDGSGFYDTAIETVSDTYTYAGTLPSAPYDSGLIGATDVRMGDVPERSYRQRAGRSFRASREIESDLTALDLGPLVSYDIAKDLRIVFSVGGTLAWMSGDFSYRDDIYGSGSDNSNDWLIGFYYGADLQYLLTENWGVFAGCLQHRLEDFSQSTEGRSAELQFDDSYSFRFGVFLR